MMRPDIMFNIVMWIANSVAWAYNGHVGMMVLSLFGVLGAVMLGRICAD